MKRIRKGLYTTNCCGRNITIEFNVSNQKWNLFIDCDFKGQYQTKNDALQHAIDYCRENQ